MNETRSMAEFVAGLSFAKVPPAVVEQTCRIVLDTMGCAVGAWREDPPKCSLMVDLVKSFAAKPEAGLVKGGGLKTHAALAAMANAVFCNAADNDDTHKRSLIHTSSVVVPTALAMAEAAGLSGPELITAIVAGYEVAVRVGMCVMPTHYRYWHSTATNGTFGSAAAAAKSLGLDAGRAQYALGFAGTQAAGLNTFFEYGDFTKSLHPGKAAFNGVVSAQLAALGATSPPTMLENEKGYAFAFSEQPKLDLLTAGLAEEWEILNNGFKFYPSILASHSAVDAVLSIVRTHPIEPREIATITNETYNTVFTHFSNKHPKNSMAARLSVPFCLAVAAVDKNLGPDQFTMERINDPVVLDVLAKTEIIADPELNSLYPEKFPARVTVTLADGREYQEYVYYPKGDSQNPLTMEELENKFRANVANILTEEEIQQFIRTVKNLPEIESVSKLLNVLK